MKKKILIITIFISGSFLSLLYYKGLYNWDLSQKTFLFLAIIGALFFIGSIFILNTRVNFNKQNRLESVEETKITETINLKKTSRVLSAKNKLRLVISFFILLFLTIILYKAIRGQSQQLKQPITKSKIKSVNEVVNKEFELKIINFSFDIPQETHSFNGGRFFEIDLEIENTLDEVIEVATLDLMLELKYKNSEPSISQYQTREFTNISFYNNNSIDVVDKIDMSLYLGDDFKNKYEFIIALENPSNKEEKNKADKISRIIEKDYNDVWYPNQVKRLKLSYGIKYSKKYNYYKAENANILISLNLKNSVGFKFENNIISEEITNKWNNAFYYENLKNRNN